MAKPKKPTQGDCRGTYGAGVCSYFVGESAQRPGEVQICQYSSRLVGPLTPDQARALAANIVAAADAVEARIAAEKAETEEAAAEIEEARVAKAETDRLVDEMSALPDYNGWWFEYMYPGFFTYSHADNDYLVCFTPDWGDPETVSIQVQTNDGHDYEEHGSQPPSPREGRTAQKLFDLVRPTLDKLQPKVQP